MAYRAAFPGVQRAVRAAVASGGGGGDEYAIPSDRVTVWQPGVTYNGGIPNRTTIHTTLSDGSTRAQIQAALDDCPVGQVVQLAAGNFNITGDPIFINKGITLRGAGPTLTTITRTDGGSNQVANIVLGRRWPNIGSSTNLTADAVKGSYSCTVASTAGLTVGELVLLDSLTETGLTYWSDDATLVSGIRSWFSRNDRPITQMMEIASIVANTVTFTTPFHITFKTARTAQLTQWNDAAVSGAAVEDLRSVGGRGGDGGGNIYFQLAMYSWARRVEAYDTIGGAARMYNCFRCEIRDSYINYTPDPNPGGAGYGVDFSNATSDCLLENCIVVNFNKVIVMRAAGGGNVVGYNYFDDGFGAGYKTIPEIGANAAHMTTPHNALFEGNRSWNLGSDSRWGNSIFITFFRNHATGLRGNVTGNGLADTSNRRCTTIQAYHYDYNFVGNVLGFAGMTASPFSGFVYEASAEYGSTVPMWVFGQGDSVGTGGVNDPTVITRTLRDGNFDYHTNELRWHGIGGAASTTPPAASVIPNSLYMTGKPSWFGSDPWPWVTPEGATKVFTLPAKARFDSGVYF